MLQRTSTPGSPSRKAATAVGITLALLLSGACATTGVNRGDLNVVSIEQEWQLGQQLEPQIAQQVKLVQDPKIVGYVNGIGQKIVRQTELSRLPWKFHVVDDAAVNAFSVPGGQVYVNTGLVTAANSAAELAAVIAHEVAHGVARHSTESLTRTYGLNLLAGALLGKDPGTTEKIAAQVLGGGALAKFSRDAEREADRLGIRYMYEAGYDPHGMATMFETLLAQRQHRPGAVEQFFASHPLTEARIADARRAADELPRSASLTRSDGRLPEVQRVAARYNR